MTFRLRLRRRSEQIIDFGKQNIHVLANAITELTTGPPHVVEPGKKIIPDFPVQADSGFQRLLEHSHEGIQVTVSRWSTSRQKPAARSQ